MTVLAFVVPTLWCTSREFKHFGFRQFLISMDLNGN